jgi:hypothetical protein
VIGISATDSVSPKTATAKCPTGKVAISAGYDIEGGKDPSVAPNGLANVIADTIDPSSPGGSEDFVLVEAWEEEPTPLPWAIHAAAMCATVSP